MLNRRNISLIAALFGGLAVLFGAFGAHALQLESPQSGWFQTANQYHFYHSLALLILPALSLTSRWAAMVASSWLLGLLLFSGSLYLAAAGLANWFWITPVGGLALLSGWVILVFAVLNAKHGNSG